ncbi:helix-turn-helix transcriptional regulator [Streptomyces albidoflavus]|uniref:helix-turn-helix transcriptional regulator n=1 Tax=Streptomyces albidoflavus TaxID=1886 RepID=UPI000249442E
MTLVERGEELDLLDRLLAEAHEGRGHTVVVSGPVATGKSALLRAFAERAVDSGALALAAIAAPEESGVPLGVMDQLLYSAPLTDAQRAALPGLFAEPDAPATARALASMLFRVAEERPVALSVDDAHHADPASLACLFHLTRRQRGSRVTVALGHSGRPAPAAGRPGGFPQELLRLAHCHRVVTRPLSAAGVTALAERWLGPEAGEAVAADWRRMSGGNPLLLDGLLEDHRTAGRVPGGGAAGGAAAGDGLAQAVLALLWRNEPDVLRVAQGLAVLGDVKALDRLLDLDPVTVTRSLSGLEAGGLLGPDGFRHEVARSAVLMELDAVRRAALHRRAAELLQEAGRAPADLAAHLVAAGPVDEPWAVPALESGAAQAVAEGRVEAAVGYLKLARRLCQDAPGLARITLALVRVEWRINPGAPLPYLTELTEALHRGHLTGRDGLVLAKALLWHGRYDAARDVLVRVGAQGRATEPETLAELWTTRRWLRRSFPPFLDCVPADDSGQEPRPLSLSSDGRRLLAATTLDTVLSDGVSDQVVAEAEWILRHARLDDMAMDTVESALLALTYGDGASRAAPWCDGLIEDAAARQSPGRQAQLTAIRAEISFRQGDLPAAERHARQALSLVPANGWGVAIGAAPASLVTALTAMGRHDEAARQLGLPVPDAMLQSRYGLLYLQARGRHALATGRPDAALEDFRACGALMTDWDLDAPGLIAWRGDAAETYLQLGDPDEARRLLSEQLDRWGPRSGRVHGVALRQFAATHELRRRPPLLRKSADLLQEAGDRYELARALTDLARAYRDLGGLRRARLTARRAWSLALECRARPLAGLLGGEFGWRSEVTETPRDSTAATALSDAERRVAELAAQGHTNREIAKRLYVTVSTIEQHLTRIYRKLGVSSRGDLPSAITPLVGAGR